MDGLQGYETVLKKRRAAFEEKHGDVEYEFQVIGKEMEKYFKKNIWYLFYRYSLDDIKYAFEQCRRYDKPHLPYFLAVIRNRYKA